MKKTFIPVFKTLTASSLLLQSCATIISGSSQSVRLVGQPAGSTVYVNDAPVPTKPVDGMPDAVSIRLPRKKTSEVKVKQAGYKDYAEVLYPAKINPAAYLNMAFLPLVFVDDSKEKQTSFGSVPSSDLGPFFLPGLLAPLLGGTLDWLTGAVWRLNKTEIRPQLVAQPRAVAGSQTVQCGAVNVRVKGGDKMGSIFLGQEPIENLYFGKSLDVNADNLCNNVNMALKDLGYAVPAAGSQHVFSAVPTARYTLQAEMRDIRYDIHSSLRATSAVAGVAGPAAPYVRLARYETNCTVDVTWKLVGPDRQAAVEQKTSGSSVRFENGGTAAFEDAFENALYAFLSRPDVATALTQPGAPVAGTAADSTTPAAAASETAQPAAIAVRRAAPLRLTADNGVAAAAKCVVTLESADGHGSGCLISADGYLISNAHVVGGAETVQVLLPEGIQTTGKVVRVNAEADLALVKIDVDNLTGFQLPTASVAEIGADVFAIGTPADKELGQSITKGIISGRRKIEGHTLLQTDVSISGGNSGGALVSRSGQLLGIVNAKLVGRGIEGIGFAIPAEQVAEALQLKFID